MLSSLAWVKKGAAKERPIPYDLQAAEEAAAELAKVREAAEASLAEEKAAMQAEYSEPESGSDSEEEGEAMNEDRDLPEDMSAEEREFVKKYQLDDYGKEKKSKKKGKAGQGDDMDFIFSNIESLTVTAGGDSESEGESMPMGKDPYLQEAAGSGLEEEPDELEDWLIKPTDSLIIGARTEEELSSLEVYLVEEEGENWYVHHDIMLPSYPLCLEWQTAPQGVNAVAVGTFDPEIEIWNLDVIDPVYPEIVLGAESSRRPNDMSHDNKAKKKKKAHAEQHVDAVMCLSWNKTHANLIASGSADGTIKIWDVMRPLTALASLTPHDGQKIQSVAWSPAQAASPSLLSGGYDQKAVLSDARTLSTIGAVSCAADVEVVKWHPSQAGMFMASDESGLVQAFDVRQLAKPLFRLQAHGKATTAVDFHPLISSCFMTASLDKSVKLWDLSEDLASPVQIFHRQDANVGKIFAASFCPDSPFLVALAGSKGKLNIWRLHSSAQHESNDTLRNYLQQKLAAL